MNKKIAFIGASFLQLPLVLKARSMGIETIVFAWEDGAVAKEHCDRFYPISIVDKEQILAICKNERIDGITSIASDLAVPTIAYVALNLGLIGNSLRSALLSTNKDIMRDYLSAAGLRCPSNIPISSPKDPMHLLKGLRYPLIVKPVDRSGCLGVKRIDWKEEVVSALDTALQQSFVGRAIVEEFIEGVEVSVETISWEGHHHHLMITDKITSGPPHFVELAHHQPSALPDRVKSRILEMTMSGLNALEIAYGASHAEFIIAGEDIYVTEIGARMGGDFIGSDLVQLSTGYDFLEGVIEVALGSFHSPRTDLARFSGVYFYSSETPEVLELIENQESLPEVVRAERTKSTLPPLHCSGDRSGYVLYQSDERFLIL